MIIAGIGLALALVVFCFACIFFSPQRAFLAAITFVPGAMVGCLLAVLARAAIWGRGGTLTSGAEVGTFLGSLLLGGLLGGSTVAAHFLGVDVVNVVRRTLLKLRGREP
jgi:hypothetical protein